MFEGSNLNKIERKEEKDMAYDYSKLRGRIIEMFGSQEAFAERVGQTPTTISYKLNNKSPLTRKDVIEWGKTLLIENDNIGLYFFTEKV